MNQLPRTITSLEVAEMVERNHFDVMRDIRKILSHLGESKNALSYFIESTYTNNQNKELPCYQLTKKGCELYGTRMTGEKGTLFAVQYIERFNQMEHHISSGIDTSRLSPELQLMNQMVQAMAKNEIETREAKQLALQATESVNNISNIVSITSIEWRDKVNIILKKIASKWTGIEPFRSVKTLSYERLEKRAGCKLDIRLNNRKERAVAQGMSKSYVQKINKLDVIAEEKRLVEIYIQVVKEMAIEFRVNVNNFKFEEII